MGGLGMGRRCGKGEGMAGEAGAGDSRPGAVQDCRPLACSCWTGTGKDGSHAPSGHFGEQQSKERNGD